MAAARGSLPAKKVFDVAKPLTTPADTTSKPVIVSQGPMVKDSSVINEPDSEAQPEPAILSGHTVLQPLDHSLEQPAAHNPEPQPQEQSPKVESENEPDTAPANDSKELTETGEAGSKSDEAAQHKLEEEALKKQAEHEAAMNSLIESGKYFLPINAVEKRKSRHIAVAGIILSVVLALVWYDVALDAGLLSNTLHLPHTHFFALKS